MSGPLEAFLSLFLTKELTANCALPIMFSGDKCEVANPNRFVDKFLNSN